MDVKQKFRAVKRRLWDAEVRGWFPPDSHSFTFPIDLSGNPPKGPEKYRRAAVLFLIGCRAGSDVLHILITKRSQKVGSHAGETCLPGGMLDAKDTTLIDTALRETEEEVGIDHRNVEVITSLPPFLSGWFKTTTVTPVVGCLLIDIDKLDIQANEEVECAFWVPLLFFLSNEHHRTHQVTWRFHRVSTEVYDYKEPLTGHLHQIWGLTSRICTSISQLVLGEPPHFPLTNTAIFKVDQETITMKELIPLSSISNTLYSKYAHVTKSKL